MVAELSLYIHIPFCLQRCLYCDFATYDELQSPLGRQSYLELLALELTKGRRCFETPVTVKTLYFGGGTPSLLTTKELSAILNHLHQQGFHWTDDCEITVEINPATLDRQKIKEWLALGVNRFSVGAQTFCDEHLQRLGRRHSAQDVRDTLQLLQDFEVSYSADLLYALPQQTMGQLKSDLEELVRFAPPHISAYYLTLRPDHVLQIGRPEESIQSEMIRYVRSYLHQCGYEGYEISNFAKSANFYSKHNMIYWTDQAYWGLGLSAHSYFPKLGPWGTRFFNPPNMKAYASWVAHWQPRVHLHEGRKEEEFEVLQQHEALTDFCHTSLRKAMGLNLSLLESKFGKWASQEVQRRLQELCNKEWVFYSDGSWRLTPDGQDWSNQVFLHLTFLESELRDGLDIPRTHLKF